MIEPEMLSAFVERLHGFRPRIVYVPGEVLIRSGGNVEWAGREWLIRISAEKCEAEQLRTLTHEVAHIMLGHVQKLPSMTPGEEAEYRRKMEGAQFTPEELRQEEEANNLANQITETWAEVLGCRVNYVVGGRRFVDGIPTE